MGGVLDSRPFHTLINRVLFAWNACDDINNNASWFWGLGRKGPGSLSYFSRLDSSGNLSWSDGEDTQVRR